MRKRLTLLGIVILIIIAGILFYRYSGINTPGDNSQKTAHSQQARKVLYWVAPTNPHYRRDKPGKSPMGMDLVPVYADATQSKHNIVTISPAVEQHLGIKSAIVKPMDLPRIIDTVGYVTVNENNIEHIHAYTDGWVKILNVKTTGEPVKKGQLLLELYSPALNNAQQEWLLALKNNNPTLIRAGEMKLVTLGMPASQIKELRKTRRMMTLVKIHATQSGIVSQLNVREGKFIKPAVNLMTIENLSPIWIIADVFERQAGWVKVGQPALALLSYLPGKTWQGKVDYVYPQLDAKTRTLRVRLTFPNPDLTFKPNMYATVKIFGQTVKHALAIPRSAVIRTGAGDRVILALDKGRFQAQPVKLGIESGDYYQILSGVTAGDKVVTSAQFLIDSESNLKADIGRIQHRPHFHSSKPTSSNHPHEFIGMGTVRQVDLSRHTLTLFHQPIAALNMPAMAMALPVNKTVNLVSVKAGDEIYFVLVRQGKGRYVITKINVIQVKPSSTT